MPEKMLSSSNGSSMRAIVDNIKAARQQRMHRALERTESVNRLKSDTKLLIQDINDLREQIRKDNVRRKKQTEAMWAQHQNELRQSVQQLSRLHQQFMMRLQTEHNELRQELQAKAMQVRAELKANEQTRMQTHQALMNQIHQLIRTKQEEVERVKDKVRELKRQTATMMTAYTNERRENQAIWAELSHRAPVSTSKVAVSMPKPADEPSEIEKQFAISIPFAKQKK